MSLFYNDTFTGASDADNLATHVGEIGATYALLTGTDAKLTAAGRCYPAGTGATKSSGVPFSADYSVFAEVQNLGGTIRAIGIGGRWKNQATMEGYMVRFVDTTGTIQCYRYVAGTPTQLGTTQTVTLPASGGVETKLMELRMAGTSIKVIYDGATIVDVTDSGVSDAGFAMIRGAGTASTTTGLQFTRVYGVDAASDDTITGTDFTSKRVYQRTVATLNRSHTFAGTYTGSPADVQIRVEDFDTAATVVDWTSIAFAGGAFSAAVTVPQGNLATNWKYKFLARTRNSGGNVLSTWTGSTMWMVGANFADFGQSNEHGYGDTVYTTADAGTYMFSTVGSGSWTEMADPWYSGGGASPGPSTANNLASHLDCPVAIIPHAPLGSGLVGVDGTVWGYRNESDHDDPTTVYGAALTRVLAAGGQLEGVFWGNGATDAQAGVSTANYLTAFNNLVSWLAEDLGASHTWVISQVGRTVAAGSYDAGYNAIREAHRQIDNGTSQFLACSTMNFAIINPDIGGGNNSHYGGASQAVKGHHYAQAYAYSLGLTSTYGDMRIAGTAFVSTTVVRVTLAHRAGTDFTPTSSIIGFVLTDSVGQKTIDTAARVDATHIDLTCSTACVGATTITYLAGKNPSGPSNLLVDNQATPYALQPLTVAAAVGGPKRTSIMSPGIRPLMRAGIQPGIGFR